MYKKIIIVLVMFLSNALLAMEDRSSAKSALEIMQKLSTGDEELTNQEWDLINSISENDWRIIMFIQNQILQEKVEKLLLALEDSEATTIDEEHSDDVEDAIWLEDTNDRFSFMQIKQWLFSTQDIFGYATHGSLALLLGLVACEYVGLEFTSAQTLTSYIVGVTALPTFKAARKLYTLYQLQKAAVAQDLLSKRK